MPRTQPSRRGAVRFLVATGVAWALAAWFAPSLLPLEPVWLVVQWPLLLIGLALCASAMLVERVFPTRIAMGVGVSLWSAVFVVGLVEVAARRIGFDFRGEAAAAKRLPPYYREPRFPSGTVFFRRHGPEEWTGQPIRTWLALSAYEASETYREEPVITVKYDGLGFRNEQPMNDWEIAVAGDSFVELGCLAYEDLFTTRLARGSRWRVRHLGASNTGPLTHLHYLEEYGLAAGLKQAVIVFYEGNDLQDIAWESAAVKFHARTGKRGYRTIRRQTSPLGALFDGWHRPPPHRGPTELSVPVHLFDAREGPLPVTLPPYAPDPSDLASSVVEAWEGFLRRYRELGLRHGIEVWIAYMPCKARVLHGALHPLPGARGAPDAWEPTPLPGWISQSCGRQGIGFIDLTPPLRAAVEKERACPFNAMVDTHLNARGSEIVARELTARLGRRP